MHTCVACELAPHVVSGSRLLPVQRIILLQTLMTMEILPIVIWGAFHKWCHQLSPNALNPLSHMSPFPGVLMRFTFLIPRGTKLPHPHLLFPEEQNLAYFTLKLSIFVLTKYNLSVKSYNLYSFFNWKVFQNSLHLKTFSKRINSFTLHFWLLLLFLPLTSTKSQKQLLIKTPEIPEKRKFIPPKPEE